MHGPNNSPKKSDARKDELRALFAEFNEKMTLLERERDRLLFHYAAEMEKRGENGHRQP